MLCDIKAVRNALSEVPPMPARHRSALLAALWLLAATVPALADEVMLPREPQIGPRPFYLVDKMRDGALKQQLSQCTGPFRKTDFSIGHRGAALEFPEHSRESYIAAARMGAAPRWPMEKSVLRNGPVHCFSVALSGPSFIFSTR